MTARFIVADVFDGLATLPDHSVDLVVTSPPFLALRSYLPADHPDKSKEIGSEATPAEFIDVLLKVTAELRRVLAPHGSICIELGDTYAGTGGAGGDWSDSEFTTKARVNGGSDGGPTRRQTSSGWPLTKSRTLIPQLYEIALAYGINPLTGQSSPAGKWRIRNVVTWARPNPPVGALGDKWRPATSDLVVACVSDKRYWDDLATRRPALSGQTGAVVGLRDSSKQTTWRGETNGQIERLETVSHPSGAPLLDYWEIPLLDDEEAKPYGPAPKPKNHARIAKGAAPRTDLPSQQRDGNWNTLPQQNDDPNSAGAPLLDYWEIPPTGYSGSHYAVFPPALVEPCVKAMCPPKVCRTCGEPSRRTSQAGSMELIGSAIREAREAAGLTQKQVAEWFPSASGGVTGCVWNWENGANVPMPDQWQTLREGLHMSSEYDYLIPDRDTVDYEHVSDHPSGWTQDADGRVYQRLPARKNRVDRAGWTDCGHDNYRPGLILDPFAGSGTTLLVATGHGHDAIGIDLDERNADLARDRVGPFMFELVTS